MGNIEGLKESLGRSWEKLIFNESDIKSETEEKTIEVLENKISIRLPKFSNEQIEEIVNMYPEKYICKEELKKIIEKELSGKEIVEIPREFKRNSANEESKKRGGNLLSKEGLVIINMLRNKQINLHKDILNKLNEMLQMNCYWSGADYSDNTIWIMYKSGSTGSCSKSIGTASVICFC